MQVSPTGRRLTFTPEPQKLTFGRIVTEMREGGYFFDADYSDLEKRIEHFSAEFPEEAQDEQR